MQDDTLLGGLGRSFTSLNSSRTACRNAGKGGHDPIGRWGDRWGTRLANLVDEPLFSLPT
jgi:hypothetical protein